MNPYYKNPCKPDLQGAEDKLISSHDSGNIL
jgi:hypothetical protein